MDSGSSGSLGELVAFLKELLASILGDPCDAAAQLHDFQRAQRGFFQVGYPSIRVCERQIQHEVKKPLILWTPLDPKDRTVKSDMSQMPKRILMYDPATQVLFRVCFRAIKSAPLCPLSLEALLLSEGKFKRDGPFLDAVLQRNQQYTMSPGAHGKLHITTGPNWHEISCSYRQQMIDMRSHQFCSNQACPYSRVIKVGFTLKSCARCHAVEYCSKKCQQTSWGQHKQRCRFLGAVRTQAFAMAAQEQTFATRSL